MFEARDIRKAYGGVVALHGVDFTVRAGSAHALLGENGAGKSTLVKIIGGAVRPDDGTLSLDGRPVRFQSTAEAVAAGVAVVSQELNLFPDLDVLSNLFPMREPKLGPFVDRGAMTEQAAAVLDELGLHVALTQTVASLTLAQRQLLEIARALVSNPRVLVLDEPTSALEAQGVDRLMEILNVVRARQVGVVYVSHVLEEVMSLCDEVTVLRDGRTVIEAAPRSDLTVPAIVAAMLGDRELHRPQAAADAARDVDERRQGVLQLEHVTVDRRLRDVSLAVESGEVVGLAGLAGSGHLAVLEAVFGLRRVSGGRILAPGGRAVRSQREALARGVALVSGDRHRVGLMLDKPVWENIAQVRAVALRRAGHLIRRGALRARARRHVERLNVRVPHVDVTVGRLSGGNQQKIVFAKWLEISPSVLLLDDPTRGVDVGTKAEMHDLIRAEAAAGAAVLLASTDIDELATVCDRVVVFFHHEICAVLDGDDLAQHAILEAMNTGSPP
ncbi:MAG TPA: sugar ABC transporter ATP-binding protein [Gaiellaceae bacterium]|nr:sugar ABC transporter ATP-binding protein [Gaiellaceae bacterium]